MPMMYEGRPALAKRRRKATGPSVATNKTASPQMAEDANEMRTMKKRKMAMVKRR